MSIEIPDEEDEFKKFLAELINILGVQICGTWGRKFDNNTMIKWGKKASEKSTGGSKVKGYFRTKEGKTVQILSVF